MDFSLQPDVYRTGSSKTLLEMLDAMWMKSHKKCGEGTLYVVSGFANYNGGVRFYPYFTQHSHDGGDIKIVVGGSTSQKLSSQQAVKELLQCGAEVYVVNRKKLLHAKCYGYAASGKEELVVSSGNFTGPGMTQNVEASIHVDDINTKAMGFSWENFILGILSQSWDVHHLTKSDVEDGHNPAWSLLYDEVGGSTTLEDSQQMTMVVTLSHSDTARIQATRGTPAGLGTQYFWLSKGSFDFFPALTEKNKRGVKNTFSCKVNINYVDLKCIHKETVTFEADNNLDFRMGTSALRYSRLASRGDLAVLTRKSEYDYELRIVKQYSPLYEQLIHYATTYIGHLGKRFGYLPNDKCFDILGIR